MQRLIVSSTLFISLAALYFCLQIYPKDKRQRFVFLALLSLVVSSVFKISIYWDIETRVTNEIVTPPFAILAFVFLFRFLYEHIKHKQVPVKFIIFNLLPVFLWTLIFIANLMDLLPVSSNFNLYFVGKSTTVLIMGTIYFIILYRSIRGIKMSDYEGYYYFTGLVLQMMFICLLLGLSMEAFFITEKVSEASVYIFRLLILTTSITLYFYLFSLYQSNMETARKKRLESLTPIAKIPLGFVEAKEDNVKSEEVLEKENLLRNKAAGRYGKALLNITQLGEYQEKIIAFFEGEPEYLDMNFNLSRLSQATDLPKQYLSQAFNLGIGLSFNEYLNQKRIEYALRLLKENKDITITELSESCGYKSRASFYKNFKTVTGYNVTEYRQRQNAS